MRDLSAIEIELAKDKRYVKIPNAPDSPSMFEMVTEKSYTLVWNFRPQYKTYNFPIWLFVLFAASGYLALLLWRIHFSQRFDVPVRTFDELVVTLLDISEYKQQRVTSSKSHALSAWLNHTQSKSTIRRKLYVATIGHHTQRNLSIFLHVFLYNYGF